MSDRIQAAHKALLEYVKDQPVGTEAAFGLSMDGAVVAQNMGEMGRVTLPYLPYDHIVIHNHPDCGPLSHKDIEQFIWRDGLQGVTAVGNDGSIYGLFKGPDYDGYGMSRTYLNKLPEFESLVESGDLIGYLKAIENLMEEAGKNGAELIRRGTR